MCLFGDQQSFMPQELPINLSDRGKRLRSVMRVIMLVHLVFAIVIAITIDPYKGLLELFPIMMLCCGLQSLNFCMLLFYMFVSIFSAVDVFSKVGFSLQTGEAQTEVSVSNAYAFLITVYSLLLVFYVVAITITFFTYREFKQALFIYGGLTGVRNIGAPLQSAANNSGGVGPAQQNPVGYNTIRRKLLPIYFVEGQGEPRGQVYRPQDQQQQRTAFQGRGIRLGDY